MTNRTTTHRIASQQPNSQQPNSQQLNSQRMLHRPTMVAAALVLAFAAATAQGQHLGHGEFIVGQQVVSDTVVDPAAGSSYAGDIPVSDGEIVDGGVVGDGAGGIGRSYGQPDLFYNYYTQGNQNTSNAQMYVSPLPVPARVGHTYNTYQPFYPEEYLYWHKNRFHKYYDNGRGMNRTRALYYSPPVRQAISNIYWNKLRIPR